MRRALLTFVLFIAALVPDLAFAQPGRFEITPSVGYRFRGDLDATSNDFFDPSIDASVDESAVFGVTFGVGLTPSWRLELLANRQETSFIVDSGILSPETELGDVTLDFYHVGLAYEWSLGTVNPYLVLSGGLARIKPDFPELNAENRLSGSFGGGLKIYFSDNVGLRLEGRGYWTDVNSDFDDRYDRYNSDDGLYQGEASAGLLFSF